MSLTGDFGRLQAMQRLLGYVYNGTLRQKVLFDAAPTLSGLVSAGFDRSVSPRGRGWRSLRQPRPRGRPNRGGPLVSSGALRDEASTVEIDAQGYVITLDLPYAARHQYGDKGRGRGRIPARPYLPRAQGDDGQGLPRAWRLSLDASANQTWRRLFVGARQ